MHFDPEYSGHGQDDKCRGTVFSGSLCWFCFLSVHFTLMQNGPKHQDRMRKLRMHNHFINLVIVNASHFPAYRSLWCMIDIAYFGYFSFMPRSLLQSCSYSSLFLHTVVSSDGVGIARLRPWRSQVLGRSHLMVAFKSSSSTRHCLCR